MIEFFAMGGYGVYVWTAYLISTLVIGGIGIRRYQRLGAVRKKDRALINARANTNANDKSGS